MNTFSNPKKIVEQLVPLAGMHVAEFGVGSGAYTQALAEKIALGASGALYAIDIQKDILGKISDMEKTKERSAIHVVWGDLEEKGGSRLRDGSVQMVVVANILFQVGNKQGVIAEAYRVLEKGGRIALVEWSDSFGNIGPKAEHIVSEEQARTLCEEQGFTIERMLDAGEHHYGFIAVKV